MYPDTNTSWPSTPQPQQTSPSQPAHWWKLLLTHKIWLITGVVSVIAVGGILFAIIKHNADNAAVPDQQTTDTNKQQVGSNNKTTTPPANPDKAKSDADKSKTDPKASTPQAGSSQGGTDSGTGTGGGTDNGGGNNGPVGCATNTPHIPDGPDGMGGCWPGASNTGPNAPKAQMAAYGGSCTINSANVTIDSKIINCSPLSVGSGASGLVIKNSYIMGGVISNGTATFTIQDSLLDNGLSYPACSGNTCSAGTYACGDPGNATTECGVGYKNFTILRTEIINSNRAAYCESNCTIQDSYFHGTNLWPDASNLAHASSVRNEQYLTLRHNSLGCDYQGPFPNGEIGCSADMSGYPDFAPIMHDTIDKNLFLANNIGAGFCVYGGGSLGKPFSSDPDNATYISFTNNIFQRGNNGMCGTYGPVTDFIIGNPGNVWTNNKYDNGDTVDPA